VVLDIPVMMDLQVEQGYAIQLYVCVAYRHRSVLTEEKCM